MKTLPHQDAEDYYFCRFLAGHAVPAAAFQKLGTEGEEQRGKEQCGEEQRGSRSFSSRQFSAGRQFWILFQAMCGTGLKSIFGGINRDN